MKKMILLGALLFSAVAGYAQESRQDVSISGYGLVNPVVHGNSVTLTPTDTAGFLGSYRYLVTPRSGLELNYSFAQNTNYFQYGGNTTYNPIHTRQQEISAAYVYGRTYGRYTPFAEAGIGGILFGAIHDNGTSQIDAKRTTTLGGLFGAGLAYELSPSFDIRVEYRGIVSKVPDFGITDFNTSRYQVINLPSLGVAYHF